MDERVKQTQTEQEIPLQIPSVGEVLRNRREELGWSISDVAKWSRIQQTYIEALETGQYHLLPAEVYTLGFLRTYAQLLGLDSSFLVDHYRQENRVHTRQSSLNFPSVVDSQRFTPAISLLLGFIVIIVSYVGWYHFTNVMSSSSDKSMSIGGNSPFGKTGGYTLSPSIVTMLPDQTGEKLLPPQGVAQSGKQKSGGAQEGDENGVKKMPTQFVSSSLAERESVNTSVNKVDTEKKSLQVPVQALLRKKHLSKEVTQEATENVSVSGTSSEISGKHPIVKSLSSSVETSSTMDQGILEDEKPLAKSLTHTRPLHIVKKQKSHLKSTSLTTEDLNERQLEKLGVQ